MEVLLTGATGFIGRALITYLTDRKDINTNAAVRSYTNSLPDSIKQVVIGDIQPTTDWKSYLKGVDVVIHTAARVHIMNDSASDPLAEFRKVNVEGALNLARQAAAAGVKRFIFISSIKVNGELTELGVPFNAEDKPDPVDPYSISKMESELGLLQVAEDTGLEVVIIRPPLVYGPGVKANFQSMMHWINRGIPLPLGSVRNKRSFVALDNLIDLIITCLNHPAAANQIFLAGDGEDLSTTELLQRVGKALGKPARLVSVPVWMISIVAKLLGKTKVSQRLLSSLQVDITKTKNILNWQPPVSVDKALQKTAQAFLRQQSNQE